MMLDFCFLIHKRTYSVEEARKKLERYCSYQDRCHQEIERKLFEMNMIVDARELIIISLIENDFLNEERFSKSFARGKFRIKKWGKRRITRELKSKNISDYNINIALKEISDEAYYKAFDELAIKRLHQIEEENRFKRRKKLADYLLYRGWENSLVYEKTMELIP